MNFENHPCFNDNVRGQYSRIHLPVAPKCNIQCNYCDRKYSCVNESRPGVTSAVLSPWQAIVYLEKALQKAPDITVMGIAGPGDPFANPEETIETLRLVRDKYPEMLLCLATNGLNIEPYIDEIAELKVSHVTLTVNAVDPVIGSKIYAWVRDGKRIYRGNDGAALLWERQRSAILRLKEKGITVKINSIYIPGINDSHLEDVSKIVASLGADILNCLPLYQNPGSDFRDIQEPNHEDVHEMRQKLTSYLPQMLHCTRCRADAIGKLGEEMDHDDLQLLKNCSILPLKPQEIRNYIAVTSMEGILINQHLGEAEYVWIFEPKENSFQLIEKRKTPPPGGGAYRWKTLANLLGDCKALMVNGIGQTPRSIITSYGVKVIETEGFIEEVIHAFEKGVEIRTIPKKKCGDACNGNGMGCG